MLLKVQVLFFYLRMIELVHSQRALVGKYPPEFDVAKSKTIYTTAPDSTCGHPSATDYCEPVDSQDGLAGRACSIRICQQKCPHRDRKTDTPLRPLEVLNTDPGPCVAPDYQDSRVRGGNSYRFENDRQCFLVPRLVARLGVQAGEFTLAVWLKQAPLNAGVIFEKMAGPGRYKRVVLTIMVHSRAVILQYLGRDNQPHYQMVQVPFPPNQWNHLAIQVYGNDISVFINGTELDGTPYATAKLAVAMQDVNQEPLLRVGQRLREWNATSDLSLTIEKEFPKYVNSTGQYVGRMQDYLWYDKALTNREIQEIATGIFPKVNIQSHCLCPPGVPRVHPIEERSCLPNGVPDTITSVRRPRLNVNAHPLAYIIDGESSTTWISRPELYMPGGLTFNINLENGEYQILYISIQFYSSQPKAITISRNSSMTDGEIEPWGYFADDCDLRFKYPNNGPLLTPTSVNCLAFKKNVPYRNGNVTFELLLNSPMQRPGSLQLYETPELMDFMKATLVQIRFENQYYTLNHDVSLKHQFYGVRGIEVIGRCNCHGHADSCDSDARPYQCKCLEESNTEGHMCERCKPLYNNKEFRSGDSKNQYPCQRCSCNNHADSCHYDRNNDTHPDDFFNGGGGICDNCKDNTMGRYCEQCKIEFYREPDKELNAKDVCQPCRCRKAGTIGGDKDCEKIGGQCLCKAKVTSRRCNTCVNGYYNLNKDNDEGCEECSCTLAGAVNRSVSCQQVDGQCNCKANVRGRTCSQCQYEYKNLTDSNPDGCEPCNCNRIGATGQHCNPNNGQCHCRDNVQGMFCDECQDGFWGLSETGCQPCGCGIAGTEPGTICDKQTGQCVCKANTQGRTCNECVDKYYNLNPDNRQGCEFCNCDARGTLDGSLVCDKTNGVCACKPNVDGRVCNLCKGNTFGLRASLDLGCEPCNCDPMGTSLGLELQPHELVCDSNSGQCACLPSREGRRCDQCSSGFYLPRSNETGCLVCDCHPVGSTSQVCHNVTGMCPCKPEETGAGLTGRRCDQCARTFWNFHRLFGSCDPCNCDEAGSKQDECNVITGQCSCKGNVIGQQCDTCRPGSSQLSASNPMGCYSHPKQQAAPTETNVTSRWITLTWNPPDYPNGDVISYKLSRNGKVVYNITDISPFGSYNFNDTGLLPYTNYDYSIETSNIGGSAFSPTSRVKTLSGIPTGVPPLKVSNIRARQAMFQWGAPEVAHGPIEKYVLQSVTTEEDDVVEVHYWGLSTLVVIDTLTPFTNYTFTLRACTSGGCGNSVPVVVLTPEAKPAQQQRPMVVALSNTSLQVSWDPPDEPNGVILQYEVMMRGKPGNDGMHSPLQRRVFRSFGAYNPRPSPSGYNALNPPESNFTVDDLEPFTQYEFLVSSVNSLGSVESSWTTARTLEGAPVFMHPPSLHPLSSFEMNITWKTPHPVIEARGDVVMYQVILTRNNTSGNPYAPPTEDVVIYSCGPLINHFVAKGFQPYSSHVITMKLCNSVACILSSSRNATTLPAAPEGQLPPVAERSREAIDLTWPDPREVNGPQPTFMLLKSRVAFGKPPIEMSRGVRFPGHSYVRFPSSTLPRDASYTGIELWFKTFYPNSLLFLAMSLPSSGGVREEYTALQLRDGRPWFLYDAQNNPTAVTTSNDEGRRYDDGQWHRIEANRFNRDGFIELDGVYTGSKTSEGTTTVIGMNDGVYVGGVPSDFATARPDDHDDHVVVNQNLIGCIKDIRVQRSGALGDWSNVTWQEGKQWYRAYPSWQGCPINMDRPSVHFLGRGHLTMSEKLGVLDGSTWSVKMSLRTEFTSGILFYATGRGNDFIVATLRNSNFRLMVSSDSVDGVDVVTYGSNVTIKSSLCDGDWHDVKFENNQNRLSIAVDDVVGGTHAISRVRDTLDLSNDLYIGGVPHDVMEELRGVLDDDARSFGGCMRDFSIDGEHIDLSLDVQAALNVDLDGCPKGASNSERPFQQSSGEGSGDFMEATYATPMLSSVLRNNTECVENPVEMLYTGVKHGFVDDGVQENAFTRHLYKVISTNAGGDAHSDWMITRSGEGIPHVVPSPYNEQSVSGREVAMEWKRPFNAQGVIANYTLLARYLQFGDNVVNVTSNNSDVIAATFLGDQYFGTITGLSPWTKYSISLIACTLSGCTESAGSTDVMTRQEIPEDVRAPFADVNSTIMTIRWVEPKFPNGKILRYMLFHNGSEVYRGSDAHFNIRNLPVFTRQNFRLEACTPVGCNSSDDVILFSGQLPPSHVDQPMVTVRGPHTVEVRWLEPAIMNGVFEKYVIYLKDPSTSEDSPGDVVYESDSRLLFHTLDDLVAGTQYFVSLSTCTGGGCKISSATPCRTIESVPEGIPPPEVSSPDPHSFVISWSEPTLPNGVVTLYSLYQNGILFSNSTEPSSTTSGRLTPWSKHSFRVRVCTKKGCSFGPAVTERTQESSPIGDVVLAVTVLDSRRLEAKWSPPGWRNGLMHYSVICVGLFYNNPDDDDYSLLREPRVMLNSTMTDEWQLIGGLIPYSDYIVKVNASNGAGYVISNMRTVSTPPGAPDGVMKPTLTSHSPYSILASWNDPARNNAPGNALFQLNYRPVFPLKNEQSAFASKTRQMSFTLSGLSPYRDYEFQLVTSNEYGSSYSGWVSAYTMQSKPGPLDPPIVYEMDAWSLHVTWEIPSEPNGIIQAYKLYENQEVRIELPGNVTKYLADSLRPFTSYEYRIEACTEAGCTTSNTSRRVRTSATAPEGLLPPSLRSDTPASVFVTWRAPEVENGVLDSYKLERRSNESDASEPELLGVFVPSQSLRYLDEGDLLRPYTSYQYRVITSTLGGGSTASEWATVRTKPGRPEGIMAPTVAITGPESALVTWNRPHRANGPITNYEISFPEPLIRIENVTTRKRNVTNLIPFTDYQVRIIACTVGGCTQSPTTHAQTLPAVPRGLDPPIATPISERTVNIQWSPPTFPNGPGIYYELSRTTLSQPLLASPPPYINITQTVYTGLDLVYVDRELDRYTTCEYRVSVFNRIGSFASNVTQVTTLAGFPTSSGIIQVAVHNHTSVLTWWEPPRMEQLQGEVHEYIVRFNSTAHGGGEKRFPPNVTSWQVTSLHPGTEYRFELDVNNGAHTVTSEAVYATTDDGAPDGVRPLVIYSLSPTQLRASWLPPSQPNGRIIAYNIIIDDVTIHTNLTEASAYVINDLRPYTVYTLKLEACTVFACSVSNQTKTTTKETNPTGMKAPTLKVEGRNVGISWHTPTLPNGIIRSYQLQRRAMLSCSDIKPEKEVKTCKYVKCRRGAQICGSVCFAPTEQVCCGGSLYPVEADKECCDTSYVPVRGRPSDVCCGGRFHTFQENHQCCFGKLLQVNARETCCKDPVEDRVAVGAGDSCCGGVPFFDKGLQLCCGGSLHDGYEKQCCGKKMITNEKICCGNFVEGTSFDADESYMCCEMQYLPRNNTVCCSGHQQTKAHRVDMATASSVKCCSSELIASDMTCCNGIGYNPSNDVCADVATTSLADTSLPMTCGEGTLCPLGRAMFASCDRCDVNREIFDCFRSPIDDVTTGALEGNICPTPFITIYSGPPDVFSYFDPELDYYKKYEYKVIAENKIGFGESDVAKVTTPQSRPGDVYAPDWTSKDRDTITLTWEEPGKPNGLIVRYVLMRDGLELWSGLALRHTDSKEVLSYREYVYVLKACTRQGCTSSSPVRATSVQGIPEFVAPPRLQAIDARSILIEWNPPSRSNGVIERYLVNETNIGTIHTLPFPSTRPGELQYQHNQLDPYTSHTYTVTACTSVGCTSSDEVTITTKEASPEGVWYRSASLPLTSTSVELFWTEPEKPNGIIREYRLFRKVIGDIFTRSPSDDVINRLPWELVYSGKGDVFTHVDVIGRPGATLQYQLVAINSVGYGISDAIQAQLPGSVPDRVPTPAARAVSPTSLQVDWSFKDGNEDSEGYYYQVVVQQITNDSPQDGDTSITVPGRRKRSLDEEPQHKYTTEEFRGLIELVPAGSNLSQVIEGLKPHNLYKIRIRTCLAESNSTSLNASRHSSLIDCVVSSTYSVKTLSAPPNGQEKPKVVAASPRSVEVSWLSPTDINGVITGYRVYRRLAGGASEGESFEKLIYFTTDAEARTYSDLDQELRPFTRYQYQIRVSNDVGETQSDWSDVTTQQDVPTGMDKPVLNAVSAFAVSATWLPPRTRNGIITSYRLEYQEQTMNPTSFPPIMTAITAPSKINSATFSGLRPFTTYRVRVVAVNQVLLEGNSEWAQVTTLSAPPSEISNLTAIKIADGTSLLFTWDKPAVPNGKVETYNLYEVGFEETPIYTGLSRRFQFRRLSPYAEYRVILEACTGRNLCTRSPPNVFRTAETAPESQPSPIVSLSNTTSIMVSWVKPKRANGRIISYQVLRKTLPHSNQKTQHLIRKRALYSDTHSSFWFGGKSKAGWDSFVMDGDAWPDADFTKTRSRRQIDGDDAKDEGTIVYDVINPVLESYNYSDVDLQPFNKYGYRIKTSTNAGFVVSEWVFTETRQGAPEGVKPPTLEHTSNKSPTSLVVTWELPERNNGDLQTFRIQRNNTPPLSFPVSQFHFVDEDLRPYTIYGYTLTACTAGGCTTSDVTTMRTYEEAPLFVKAPNAVSLNSSAIEASWESPDIVNGIITQYRLLVDDVVRYEGLDNNVVVAGLKPYSSYILNVEACTRSGCRESDDAEVTTQEAPPSGMASPELHVTSPNSIEVIWQPAEEPNGVILRYEVHRNDELVYVNNGGASRYHDFGLNAGTEYTYHIIAFNSQGSVQSDPPVSVTTDPSAPSGLASPSLEATSSSSIRAQWEAPVNPNGVVTNYTLYVRHTTTYEEKFYDFTGSVFAFNVRGLEYFEDYLFWVRACTVQGCAMSERSLERTLESPPANQMPPRVTLPYPDQTMLSIVWSPPRHPNGVIRGYKLKRKRVLSAAMSSESLKVKSIANLTEHSFTDVSLSPYTQYQYQVVSQNVAGKAPSPWSSPVRSGEAPPSGVPKPLFYDIKSDSVRVTSAEPKSANGVIRFYHVFMKKNSSSTQLTRVSSSRVRDQTVVGLRPYTTYQILVELCTLESMCTKGLPDFVTTLPAPPSGQAPPQVTQVNPKNVTLSWSSPEQENGQILRYEIRYHKACPMSYQPFPQECDPGPIRVAYSGQNHITDVKNLLPYTRYAFHVTSYNEYGKSESEWDSVITAKSQPTYISPFTAANNISVIEIRWPNSFVLNSELVRYELSDRGENVYAGYDDFFYLRKTAAQVHEFKVTLHADSGMAKSPVLIYDTTKAGNNGILVPDQEDVPIDKDDADKLLSVPVYQRTWFILVMALVAMVIIIAVLVLIMRRMSKGDLYQHSPPKYPSAGKQSLGSISGVSAFPLDNRLHDYSIQSYPVTTHNMLDDGRINRSYSADVFNRSTNRLVGQNNGSFDQSSSNKNGRFGDQWEQVMQYDDGVILPDGQLARRLRTDLVDSGLASNCGFEDTDDVMYYPAKQAIQFVDTHV